MELSRRHRALAVAPLASLAALGVCAAGPPAASAATTVCNPEGTPGHNYGVGCLFAPSGSTFEGLFGDIDSTALSTLNPSSSLVINDMWIVNPYSSPPHFIEAGIYSGDLEGLGVYNFEFFWAAEIGSTYYVHLEGQAQSSTNYVDQIYTEGGGNWAVEIGPHSGTSTNNPLLPSLIRTGTEEYPQKEATSCSKSSNLEYQDVNGTWHSGWSGNLQSGYNSPPFSDWASPGNSLLDWAWGSDPSYSDSYSHCYGGSPPNPAPTGTPGAPTDTTPTGSPGSSAETGPPLSDAQVRQIASEFAGGMGDPNPTSIEYVESTRQQAVSALSGDKVDTNPDVYAIVMTGDFVASTAPTDGPPPTGSVLTMVINANTGALTDFGVQNQVPDLTSLGSVTVDH